MRLDPQVFNRVYPIVKMVVYPRGNVEIVRRCELQSDVSRGERDKIKIFSAASRTRLALVAKETPVKFETMITLTYGAQFPHSGLKVKEDLSIFLAYMSQSFGRFEYLWFFEFQKRGAPHVHIFTTLREPDQDKRRIMACIWVDFVQDLIDTPYSRIRDRRLMYLREAAIWFHTRKRQWERIRHPEGAARYATKYALKMEQKKPPEWFGDVGRFWGNSRAVGEIKGKEFDMTEKTLRDVLKIHCKRMSDIEILPRILFDCFPDKTLTES